MSQSCFGILLVDDDSMRSLSGSPHSEVCSLREEDKTWALGRGGSACASRGTEEAGFISDVPPANCTAPEKTTFPQIHGEARRAQPLQGDCVRLCFWLESCKVHSAHTCVGTVSLDFSLFSSVGAKSRLRYGSLEDTFIF